jgi:hypothetical protein
MKIQDEVTALGPTRRRQFLKLLSSALAAPAVPGAVRYACNELAGGKAYAQEQEGQQPTFFVEFNYRDQVDLMHVLVPPGLATHPSLRRGVNGSECTLFARGEEITSHPGRMYLTADSVALAPHLDSIAMLDTGEAGVGGIHGHEAANGMRSPGRSHRSGDGMPMFQNDGSSGGGNDQLYGRTPTPATLHNYAQKHITPELRNGFAFKGISRAGVHTVYHFSAGLPGAELDRIPGKRQLFEAFPAVMEDLNVLASAEEAGLIMRILRRVDVRMLARRGYGEASQASHLAQLGEAEGVLFRSNPRVIELPLTEEEQAHWSAGVPGQKCTANDAIVSDCNEGAIKAQIWEQFAYASKLLRSGITRSIALEFDFMDLHGDNVRTEPVLRTQAKQVALPLARLIDSLKDAGIYDRSLIAIYTLDGSRRPAANSYGDDGKGTVLLAGGMVRGGYYGDVVVTGDAGSGHAYGFRAPDLQTGEPGPVHTDWRNRGLRTPSGAVWRTVASALRVPDAMASQFTPVQDARPLRFMLR